MVEPKRMGAVEGPPVVQLPPVLERCCGLDVHKKSCTAAIISQDRLPTILHGVENSGPGIHSLHQRLVDEGCSTVVMESSGPYWMGIYDHLDLRGIKTVLVNPRSLKAIKGKKTDVDDSVWLAHLYRLGLLEASYVPPQHIRELRYLTRRHEKLAGMMVSVKNSVESQVDAFSTGITTVYKDPFGAGGTKILSILARNMSNTDRTDQNGQTHTIDVEKILEEAGKAGIPPGKIGEVERMLRLAFTPTSRGWLIQQGLDTLQSLEEQADQICDRIARHIQQHQDLSRSVKVLLSLKGIDLLSAATIVAELGDPNRFKDGKAVASYFGLVPSVDRSGPKTVLGRITKKGSAHMRRILGQISQVVSTNGALHLRRWFLQVARRRGKQKAIVALSRRILVIVWAMLRDGGPFVDPDAESTAQKAKKADTLYRRKVKALERRAQQSQRTVSVWQALHLLATDQKLRAELGLSRIIPVSSSASASSQPLSPPDAGLSAERLPAK